MTQRVAKAAFKKNNLYIKMRDTFEISLKDEQFADLFFEAMLTRFHQEGMLKVHDRP
jgi:hypothetical protein